MNTVATTEVTAAARSDIAHHLHPYTQLRQLEQDGPLVITSRATACMWSTSTASATWKAWPACGARQPGLQ